MIAPHGNPLIPASLAANGMQGAGSKAESHCCGEHIADTTKALFLANVSMAAALKHLDAYAQMTDEPMPGAVDAADLVEAACAALRGAP